MKVIIYILLIVSIFGSCKDSSKTEESKSLQLFYNGDIITMESENAVYAEAVVENNGKIIFVGSKKQAESQFSKAKKIDF